ncbi:MAG: hypothetical protein P4L59_13325, partial [Desulfosporosinus sp.]|nr:hypothetical protein [Desulfosporosinus sp.]
DLLQLMSVLKQMAFQNGIREAFIIAVIVTVIAFIAALFIGKKQKPFDSGEKQTITVASAL